MEPRRESRRNASTPAVGSRVIASNTDTASCTSATQAVGRFVQNRASQRSAALSNRSGSALRIGERVREIDSWQLGDGSADDRQVPGCEGEPESAVRAAVAGHERMSAYPG
jgi:hypothetical protein